MADNTGKNLCLCGTCILVYKAAIDQGKYSVLHVRSENEGQNKEEGNEMLKGMIFFEKVFMKSLLEKTSSK